MISVKNEEARQCRLEEARKSLGSVRELKRQINPFYNERSHENRVDLVFFNDILRCLVLFALLEKAWINCPKVRAF